MAPSVIGSRQNRPVAELARRASPTGRPDVGFGGWPGFSERRSGAAGADASSALHLRFPTAHLRQFLLGCLASFVEQLRQVLQMDAFSATTTPVALGTLALSAPAILGVVAFAIVFGLGSGLFSLVSFTLPLAIFGKTNLGKRLGCIGMGRLGPSALAPFALSLALGTLGPKPSLWVLVVAGCGCVAVFAEVWRRCRPSSDARAIRQHHRRHNAIVGVRFPRTLATERTVCFPPHFLRSRPLPGTTPFRTPTARRLRHKWARGRWGRDCRP